MVDVMEIFVGIRHTYFRFETRFQIGVITSTHGVRGEVKVLPWADSPEFLSGFSKLYLDKGADILDIISLCPTFMLMD